MPPTLNPKNRDRLALRPALGTQSQRGAKRRLCATRCEATRAEIDVLIRCVARCGRSWIGSRSTSADSVSAWVRKLVERELFRIDGGD